MMRGGAAINESPQDKYTLLLAGIGDGGGSLEGPAKSDMKYPPDYTKKKKEKSSQGNMSKPNKCDCISEVIGKSLVSVHSKFNKPLLSFKRAPFDVIKLLLPQFW